MTVTRPPNVFVFMVDELRYPTVYDSPELRAWMDTTLVAQRLFRETGVEFRRHYAQSTACAPSRTSIFTGQYPSLHGVTQTDGLAKSAWDPGMFWLDPNTVPTAGDYFRAAGYRTFYKGKWHISYADIIIPGTHDSLLTNDADGVSFPYETGIYEDADRLDRYGFSGWVGPEPHGKAKANCGMLRDPGFARQATSLLDQLEADSDDTPFLIVNSYVNPHDIVFFGLVWQLFGFEFGKDTVPDIPEPPTRLENLDSKPACQQSYVDVYPQMVLQQPTIELYRKLYYYLQEQVDAHLLAVYERLKRSRFFDNTLVVFTSDHGDLLGAHGGMHQKWYNAYEETIHVPLIFSGPLVGNTPRSVDALTSHADLLPTLLGFAGIDVEAAAKELARDHTEVQPLVGRDLAGVLRGTAGVPAGEPVYFMTSDDISRGLDQLTGSRPYEPVVKPNQIETVIVDHDGTTWKFSRYYDELDPEIEDQYELYDLTADPIEKVNLANAALATQRSREIRARLEALLAEQRSQKRLVPHGYAAARRDKGGEGWNPEEEAEVAVEAALVS
ncbi:MAG: putative arylsulfatase [Acidobacteria bacterium]|nr:putative arylsulfatase [Acidobacteriota bacterium]